MKKAKAIYLTANADPDVFKLINEYASALDILPTTAVKRFLKRTLPRAIKTERRHLTQINRHSQEKNDND